MAALESTPFCETRNVMIRRNFYASEPANGPEVVRVGFQALADLVQQLRSSAAWLVCHAYRNLDGFVEQVIGREAVVALKRRRSVGFGQECSLSFRGDRNLPYSAGGSPILACYPNRGLLDKLDRVSEVPALIVLPWKLSDVRPWLAAHGAHDILGKSPAKAAGISNPVVERAMESIVASINISSGIVAPEDKDTVVSVFRLLRDDEERYNPVEIRAWLVQKGMDAKHATAVAEVAAAPSRYRKSTSKRSWGRADLKRWRADARRTP